MSSSMSNLGIALTSLFSLILLALFSQILYLLWRRRRNRHRKTNRIEPTIPTQPHAPPPLTSNPSFDIDAGHSELLKLESLYGSSRVLFTIKEEAEKEELSENNNVDFTKIDIMNLSQRFVGEKSIRLDNNDDHVIFMVGDEDHYFDVEIEPPFLTPCGSPSYFTQSPSPPRDET